MGYVWGDALATKVETVNDDVLIGLLFDPYDSFLELKDLLVKYEQNRVSLDKLETNFRLYAGEATNAMIKDMQKVLIYIANRIVEMLDERVKSVK
jgi:hypothetical protein